MTSTKVPTTPATAVLARRGVQPMRAGDVVGLAALAAGATGAVLLERHRRRWSRLLTTRIPGHHDHWRSRRAGPDDAVLYVALGDSAALGLGASTPERGYVGLLATEIAQASGRPVRVRNLAIDGATLAVVLEDQIPRLRRLHPFVCTLDIGANDMWAFEATRFRAEFERICAALPPGSVVADVPSFSFIPVGARVRAANRIIHEVAPRHGHLLAPLNATTAIGGPFDAIRGAAGDLFHPNDRGHRRWADAFGPAVRAAVAHRIARRASRDPVIVPGSGDPGP